MYEGGVVGRVVWFLKRLSVRNSLVFSRTMWESGFVINGWTESKWVSRKGSLTRVVFLLYDVSLNNLLQVHGERKGY